VQRRNDATTGGHGWCGQEEQHLSGLASGAASARWWDAPYRRG
jgi:hypothetical protein